VNIHQRPSENLAVIPARGGSKRIPGKNIRMLKGKPLIAYTIEAAIASGLFGQIVVSTDSDEIASIARMYGAVVPFIRDRSLSDDRTPVSAATVDALRRLDNEATTYTYVAQLMANCPLRSSVDVLESHRQLMSSGSCSQISVTRFGWQNPWWAMKRDGSFELKPLFEAQTTQRSQDLPELFCPTGAIWWARAETLREAGTYHVPGRTGWEIPWERGVDIDTEDDWEMAGFMLSRLNSEAVANGA
jgi:pseudaminic acid cytidylyltransferase